MEKWEPVGLESEMSTSFHNPKAVDRVLPQLDDAPLFLTINLDFVGFNFEENYHDRYKLWNCHFKIAGTEWHKFLSQRKSRQRLTSQLLLRFRFFGR